MAGVKNEKEQAGHPIRLYIDGVEQKRGKEKARGWGEEREGVGGASHSTLHGWSRAKEGQRKSAWVMKDKERAGDPIQRSHSTSHRGSRA